MVNDAPNIVDEVDTLIPIFHQFRAKFNKCKFHTQNDFAEDHTDSR